MNNTKQNMKKKMNTMNIETERWKKKKKHSTEEKDDDGENWQSQYWNGQ